MTLTGLGVCGAWQGDASRARPWLVEEALRLWPDLDNPAGLHMTVLNMGVCAYAEGNLEEAYEIFERRACNKRCLFTIVGRSRMLWMDWAMIAAEQSEQSAAHDFWARARHFAERWRRLSCRWLAQTTLVHVASCGPRLANQNTKLQRQAGESLTFEETIRYALEQAGQHVYGSEASRRSAEPLTSREQEVAGMLAEGLSNREIAEKLTITQKTVGVHVEHILGKLDLHSRWQVADWLAAQK